MYIFISQLAISSDSFIYMHLYTKCLLGLYKSLASVDWVLAKLTIKFEELAWNDIFILAPRELQLSIDF